MIRQCDLYVDCGIRSIADVGMYTIGGGGGEFEQIVQHTTHEMMSQWNESGRLYW